MNVGAIRYSVIDHGNGARTLAVFESGHACACELNAAEAEFLAALLTRPCREALQTLALGLDVVVDVDSLTETGK